MYYNLGADSDKFPINVETALSTRSIDSCHNHLSLRSFSLYVNANNNNTAT
jgi:hypothetical protein